MIKFSLGIFTVAHIFTMSLFSMDIEIVSKGDELSQYNTFAITQGERVLTAPYFTIKEKNTKEVNVYSILLQEELLKNISLIQENAIVKEGQFKEDKEAYIFLDSGCKNCEKFMSKFSLVKNFSKVHFVLSDKEKKNKGAGIYGKYGVQYDREAIEKLFSNLGITKVPLMIVYERGLFYVRK